MKFAEPIKLHRKSGIWATPCFGVATYFLIPMFFG